MGRRPLEKTTGLLEPDAHDLTHLRREARQAAFRATGGHFQAGSLDDRPRRLPETPREMHPGERANEPFRRVPLIPADPVAIVGGKPVVEVVVPLAVGYEGEHPVVPRGVFVRIRPRAPEVRDRVDEEGRVVDDGDPKKAAPEETPERTA